MATEIFIWRPRRIKRAFFQKLGTNNNVLHIGTNVALAVDFAHSQIFLYHWGKISTFPYSLIDNANHEWDPIVDKNQNIHSKNHRVVILTNDPQKPEIRINFWTKTPAQKCIISLRQLLQSQADSPKAQQAQEIIAETPEPIVHAALPMATTDEYPPKTDAKTADVHVQDLAQILTCHLEENGFSRADAEKKVKLERFIEAVKLLENNYTSLTGEKILRGWQKNLILALKPLFLSGPNDPKGFGYTKLSLSAYVSKYTVLKTEN